MCVNGSPATSYAGDSCLPGAALAAGGGDPALSCQLRFSSRFHNRGRKVGADAGGVKGIFTSY